MDNSVWILGKESEEKWTHDMLEWKNTKYDSKERKKKKLLVLLNEVIS